MAELRGSFPQFSLSKSKCFISKENTHMATLSRNKRPSTYIPTKARSCLRDSALVNVGLLNTITFAGSASLHVNYSPWLRHKNENNSDVDPRYKYASLAFFKPSGHSSAYLPDCKAIQYSCEGQVLANYLTSNM
jgi:hypothetical protein